MPPPLPYRTVTGRYVGPDGAPVSGRLRFIPSVRVADVADNEIVPPIPVYATLAADGSFEVALAVTDDPSTSPTDWAWVLTEMFAGGSGYSGSIEYRFKVPTAAGPTVPLADLPAAVDSATTTTYAPYSQIAALAARVSTAEGSAAVSVAAVVVHPFLTMGV